jgi:hypothetical protein
MDLALYARVLWRFKAIVVVGFLVAVVLAAMSIVRVNGHGVTYRQNELWSSTTRVGVTQNGFPWGRLFAEQPTASGQPLTPSQEATKLGIPVADPNRLTGLAVLYAELATSDPVHRLMLRDGPIKGEIVATPLTVGDNRVPLPLIDLTATATSAQGARALSERTATALETYIRDQQQTNNVPASDSVIVDQVAKASDPKVSRPRSKTMPVVIFLVVMLATVGVAFLLENLRPRAHAADERPGTGFGGAAQRRSA